MLPENWRVVAGSNTLELGPGESDLALLTVFIPGETIADTYEVRCDFHDEKNPENAATAIVNVHVLPRRFISVKTLAVPSLALGGDVYTVEILVTNEGNTKIPLAIDIVSSDTIPFVIPKEDGELPLALDPSESRTIRIVSDTSCCGWRYTKHHLYITVLSPDSVPEGERITPAKLSTMVEVIPRQAGDPDMFVKLPLTLEVAAMTDMNVVWSDIMDVTLKGKGYMDEEAEHNIELKLHKRIGSSMDLFSNPYDEYMAHYWTKTYDITAGDFSSPLSPLTGNSSTGRGIRGTANLGQFSGGAFYQGKFYNDPVLNTIAGFGSFVIPDETMPEKYSYRINANVVSTVDRNILTGLYQKFLPIPSLSIELETALGADFEHGPAFATIARAQGDQDVVFYSFSGLYSGANYLLFTDDQYSLGASVGGRFFQKAMHASAAFHQEARNLDLDYSTPTAPLIRDFQLASGYSFGPSGPGINGTWKIQGTADLHPAPEYDSLENTFSLEYFQTLSLLNLKALARMGYLANNITMDNRFSQNYLAAVEYKPEDEISYRFDTSYEGESGVFSSTHKLGWDIGMSLRNEGLFLGASAGNYFFITERGLENVSVQLNASFQYVFENRHVLDIKCNYSLLSYLDSIENIGTLNVAYTLPFDLPISPRTSVGSIKGIIFDSETGKPVKDAVVRIRDKAFVSDDRGNFTFAPLEPGSYYLGFDLSRFGENWIPAVTIPYQVLVEKGKETSVAIPITKGAVLEGKVKRFGYGDASARYFSSGSQASEETLMEREGLPNIIIELSNATEVKRRVTDRDGRYAFDEILPGKWTVHVVPMRLPDFHFVEKDTFEIYFNPGQEVSLDIRVIQEKRAVVLDESSSDLEVETVVVEQTPEPTPRTIQTPIPLESTPEPGVTPVSIASPQPTPEQDGIPTPETTLQPTPEPAPSLTPSPGSTPVTTPTPAPTPTFTPGPTPNQILDPKVVPTIKPSPPPDVIPSPRPTSVSYEPRYDKDQDVVARITGPDMTGFYEYGFHQQATVHHDLRQILLHRRTMDSLIDFMPTIEA